MFGSRTARLVPLLALTIACVVLLGGMAIADNLQSDLNTSTGGLQKTVARGTLSPSTAYTQSVFLFVDETSGTANNPSYPFNVSLGSGGFSASFSGVTISGPGTANGQSGTVGWTTPAAQATSEDYTLTVAFDANTTINESPATIDITFTIAGAPSDTTAPDTTIDSAPAALTNSTSASFTYSSTESGTFLCSLDGADFAVCPKAGITYSSLIDGAHTFDVKAKDAAGNIDPTPASHAWTVDTAAPNTSITSGPAALTNSTTASFEFSSSESGSTFQCSLDGAAFDACPSGTPMYLGLGEGSHNFQVRATDGAGNTDPSPASYDWMIDLTPPAVSAPDLDAASDSGASSIDDKTNDSTPSLSGTAEAGSDFDLLQGSDVVYSTTIGAAGTWSYTSATLSDGSHTFTARATDGAGNTATSSGLTILLDTATPSVGASAQKADTSAYTAGSWTNQTVTVSYTCTDDGSGVFASPDADTMSAEGEDQSASGTCTDVAGNSASATFSNIDIDKTAPSISAAAKKADNSAYTAGTWTNQTVTVSYTCTDGLSGVASNASDDVVESEGADQSAEGACTDNAGNSASATFSNIDIDKTAPSITATAIKSDNSTYAAGTWSRLPVTVSYGCSDALSGVASNASNDVFASDGADQSAEGTCVDNAGNSASATFSNIDIDQTAPYDIVWNGGPASDGSYDFGSVPGEPTCSASDATSGFDHCDVTGYSTAIGNHTMTATAYDAAGNSVTATRSYTVHWTAVGFYSPVDMNGVLNTVKGGSTVPLKWEMFAGSTEITDPSSVVMSARTISCQAGTEDAIETLASTGGTTSPRYDATAGQFIYNWQTPKRPGTCWEVTMSAGYTSLTAKFKLK